MPLVNVHLLLQGRLLIRFTGFGSSRSADEQSEDVDVYDDEDEEVSSFFSDVAHMFLSCWLGDLLGLCSFRNVTAKSPGDLAGRSKFKSPVSL